LAIKYTAATADTLFTEHPHIKEINNQGDFLCCAPGGLEHESL